MEKNEGGVPLSQVWQYASVATFVLSSTIHLNANNGWGLIHIWRPAPRFLTPRHLTTVLKYSVRSYGEEQRLCSIILGVGQYASVATSFLSSTFHLHTNTGLGLIQLMIFDTQTFDDDLKWLLEFTCLPWMLNVTYSIIQGQGKEGLKMKPLKRHL